MHCQPTQRRNQNNLLFPDMRSQSVETHRPRCLVLACLFDGTTFYNSETMFASIVDLFAEIPRAVRWPKEQFRVSTLKPKLRNENSVPVGRVSNPRDGRK